MKVLLVSVGVLQEYILDNIKNLLLHDNTDITVITDNKFFHNFTPYPTITLIDVNELHSTQIEKYTKCSSLNREWREGFWYNTSLRMFYVHSYMKKYNIEHIIHLENDVMVYENLDDIFSKLQDSDKIYCTFDHDHRAILGFIYIPSYKQLEAILDNYDYTKNDMENFGNLSETDVETFPIINAGPKSKFNKHFNKFNAIFDAAAIGQYLGGVDKLNDPNDTRGFVNESCVVKYNQHKFYWIQNAKALWCPYVKINNEFIKIINMHIHCKMLNRFMSDNPLEDKFIKRQHDPNRPLTVLFEGWPLLQHSYGQVLTFLLIHLHKQYGPNGTLGHKMNIYVRQAPYFNPNWINKEKQVYPEAYTKILYQLPKYAPHITPDIIYRMSYTYNITVSEDNINIPKCVFFTSEFSHLEHNYFKINIPRELNPSQFNAYISVFLNQYKNIYFTTPSEWSAKGMTRYLETDNRNRVIPHGIDTSIFYKYPDDNIRNKTRQELNVKDSDILLINIGAMTSNKGILLILRALHILVNIHTQHQYKLLLKGVTDIYNSPSLIQSYFSDLVKSEVMTDNHVEYLLKNHIICINDTLTYAKINDLYNAADLYVAPYLAEGFGMPMLESLAAGLNVLVPITGSTKEYIEDIYNHGGQDYIHYVKSSIHTDQSGTSHNNINITDLVNVLLHFKTKQTKKTNETYTNMRNHIESEYSWFNVSKQLYNYFQDILD